MTSSMTTPPALAIAMVVAGISTARGDGDAAGGAAGHGGRGGRSWEQQPAHGFDDPLASWHATMRATSLQATCRKALHDIEPPPLLRMQTPLHEEADALIPSRIGWSLFIYV